MIQATILYEFLDDTYACTEWLTGEGEQSKVVTPTVTSTHEKYAPTAATAVAAATADSATATAVHAEGDATHNVILTNCIILVCTCMCVCKYIV